MKKPNSDSGSSMGASNLDQDVTAVFKRTEVIGRGKFGVVYKGHHVRTKQVYAIKVLNLDSDEDEVEDVQREVQFLASMKQTPNITHYYGSYLMDTSLWIIIEYCAGGSLRTLLRPGKIDEKYIGIIMREVLIALKYIHKDNVIHRDIKAANVLIANEGNVKLCDFGVAAQLNHSNLKRQTMAGTPYWMAPEVIMEGVYYDTKVDIWSLGITTYEIATGNPPYCDVEALRAMQLITKSKPPRLEGRHYSPMLKEFIALCLDEDPKERLSADDLLKTKFIKQHKTASTAVLKELITRYLLFRDKTKARRGSVSMADADMPPAEGAQNEANDKGAGPDAASNGEINNLSDLITMQVEARWDFDSLSSSDYILENDINVEEIPGESAVDWRSHFEQFNFAYPDEERYYYQTGTNTGRQVYQGTTVGRTQPSTVVNNSTLNAQLTNHNTAGQPSKTLKSGNTNTGVTGTHNSSTNSNKKAETKAPKKLMELFEDNDVINEEESVDADLSRITTNIPNDLGVRPHGTLMSSTAYHSHSTPALPLIQTKFSKPLKAPASAVTTAPTPIEIEIPEELPTSTTTSSALPSALSSSFSAVSIDIPAQSQSMPASHTKPRASTLSSIHVPFKQPVGLNGRFTLGREAHAQIPEEVSRRGSNSAGSSSDGSIGSAINTSASAGGGSAPLKRPLRTPSPSRVLLNHMSSPTKKPGGSPSTGPLPTMKPVGLSNENRDILLQPLNNGTPTSINGANSVANVSNANGLAAAGDKDSSRVNRDFKRNNPNLKLHMPLPTPMVPAKLLDSTDLASSGAPGGENINQFGFNTSSASNVPVSMTPISEKHMDFGNRLRRSQSVANRKNSQSADPSLLMNPLSYAAGNGGAGVSSTPLGYTANQLVQPPPDFLNMSLFLDMSSEGGEYRFVDSKPKMLDKLEMLLKMYEEGLPVVENALKKQLISMDVTYDERGH